MASKRLAFGAESKGEDAIRTEIVGDEGTAMTPNPVAVGMTLCDQVIIEKRTEKPSVIGGFLGLPVAGFPSYPQRFSVIATITDGQGDGIIQLVVTRLDSGEVVYTRRYPISLTDRLQVVYIHFRITSIQFPAAGLRLCELQVDDETIAHCRFQVYGTSSAGEA